MPIIECTSLTSLADPMELMSTLKPSSRGSMDSQPMYKQILNVVSNSNWLWLWFTLTVKIGISPKTENPRPPKAESRTKTLILDVKTRWNSTYLMLKRALELQDACTVFCHWLEALKYTLSSVEWEKVAQLVDFLRLLHETTEFLCSSKYPTLNISIPIYISLMEEIITAWTTYDASQLLPAVDSMIEKLKKYLALAWRRQHQSVQWYLTRASKWIT